MIERYTSRAMANIWSDEYKFSVWRRIELIVMGVNQNEGRIPGSSTQTMTNAPTPTPEQVERREASTGHDVVAFLECMIENSGSPEAGAYLHFGMTSSDLVDTGLAVVLQSATTHIAVGLDSLFHELRLHALEHCETLRAGRTHGQHAEPTVWGHRVADFAFAVDRCRKRLSATLPEISVAKVSGPVGTYSLIPPSAELAVAEWFSLIPADCASQVVMRDGIAHWACVLAEIATVCEAIALEVRHGQRTEVGELFEGRSASQQGSSAMPHKRNPIHSERICGLARMARGYVVPIMEGVALWHERDISHSSVERVALPDLSCIVDHLLTSTTRLIRNLEVDAARMRENMQSGQLSSSKRYLEAVASNMTRDAARAAAVSDEAYRGFTESDLTFPHLDAVFDRLQAI